MLIFLIVSLTFVCFFFVIFYSMNNSIGNDNHLVFNMFMINRVQKDMKKPPLNKVIKRNYLLYRANDKKLFKEKLDETNIKGSKEISKHPVFMAEAKDGDLIVGNLTSSSIVEYKPTIPVGLQKNGKISYLYFDKANIINKKEVYNMKLFLERNIIDFDDIDISKSSSETITDHVEKMTAKELKNKDFQSIKSIKELIEKT